MSKITGAKTSWKFLLPAWIIWSLFLLGWMLPEPFWGLHFLAFLPAWQSGLIMGSSLILLLLPILGIQIPSFSSGKLPAWVAQWVLPATLGIVAIFLFSGYAIEPDPYGDAKFIRQSVNYPPLEWKTKWIWDALNFNPLDAKGGTLSVFSLTNLTSAALQIPGPDALSLVSIWSGALFIFLWTFFVIRNVKDVQTRLLLLLTGYTTPFLMQFFGHQEVYGPSLALATGYFMVLGEATRKTMGWAWWLLFPVFLLNLKFHFTAYLLLPSLILTYVRPFSDDSGYLKRMFTWKGSWTRLYIPAAVLALIVYVLVTGSVNGPRAYTEENLTDALFLPVVAEDAAPLDKYNLFSPSHLLDYLNLILVWSTVAVGLLLGALFGARKQINWNQPEIFLSGLAFISYAGAFFLLNPLLGMGLDWDLFSLPVPALLALLVFTLKNRKPSESSWLLPGIGLTLLAIPFFAVHMNRPALSQRLETYGYHHFKTYYIGVSTTFEEAWNMDADPRNIRVRRNQVIADLRRHATPGADLEFADLLMNEGKWVLDEARDPQASLSYFQEAFQFCPELSENVYYLVINNFLLGQYSEAIEYCPRLIGIGYPDKGKAYRVAIHTAVMANNRDLVLKWSGEFLAKFPDVEFIQTVRQRALEGATWEELEAFFQSR